MAQVETVSLLRDGIKAARDGDKRRARDLLRRVTEADAGNELAWLWLATAADDPVEAVQSLRRVLAVNPANPHAANALPDALVRAGIAAAKSADRAGGKAYFAEATDLAPRNETAWLWRAGLADSPEEGVEMLGYVLRINPGNERARQGLEHYQSQMAARPQWQCPLCGHVDAGPDGTNACPGCKSVLGLEDPSAFDKPPAVRKDVVEAAARQLYEDMRTSPSSEMAYWLGIAYLNLGYPDEGVQTLQAAVKGRPADPTWKGLIDKFVKHRAKLARRTAVDEQISTAFAKPAVIVVDDSPTIRKLVSVTLSGAGYAVTEAADGFEVGEKVRQSGVPKLFILDINMPGLDGLQLCKLLRQNPETAEVPVVFLTGKDGFFNKLRGQWAGAAEYLTKPFDPQKLLATVAQLVTPDVR
jgi:twitching motility two-component system response regulator PilG